VKSFACPVFLDGAQQVGHGRSSAGFDTTGTSARCDVLPVSMPVRGQGSNGSMYLVLMAAGVDGVFFDQGRLIQLLIDLMIDI
jgi:hypothetical protein